MAEKANGLRARPYSIHVPDAVLNDLRRRLEHTRWPESLPGAEWEHGVSVDYVRQLCEHWRGTYDWRRCESRLNAYPQFLCEIDGVDLHYWHVRAAGGRGFPLVLIHGWPGSIFEFLELIGPLTDPSAHGGEDADAFDIIVPALPGFGFGGKPPDTGWNMTRIARVFHELVTGELGYPRYGAQGGDYGAIVSSRLASLFPGHVAGIHLNMAYAPPGVDAPEGEEPAATARRAAFQAQGHGYSAVQSTKPDSLTVGQTDSPAGLAAWIVEKFHGWSSENALDSRFSMDDLVTNLMFYWAPNSTASAARLYYETVRDMDGVWGYPRVEVPTAIAAFPDEPFAAPRAWVEPRYTITRWTGMPRGGHFAALEEPALLISDVRSFFRDIR